MPCNHKALLHVYCIQAKDSGKKVVPGFYAHLGMMYAKQGNTAKSEAMLLQEKGCINLNGIVFWRYNNK
jgi:hypothetical protein